MANATPDSAPFGGPTPEKDSPANEMEKDEGKAEAGKVGPEEEFDMRSVSQTSSSTDVTSDEEEEKKGIPFRVVMRAVGWCVVGFGLFIFPWAPPNALEKEVQQRLLGIVIAVVAMWIAELVHIAVTAMMIGPLLVVYGITSRSNAFRYYADPLLFLFYGAFFLAAAMARHGLDRRVALSIMSSDFVAKSPFRIRLVSMAVGWLMSMWISNTATSAILIPVIAGSTKSAGTLLGVAYACNAGGIATLVGTPPNLIVVRLLSEEGSGFDIGFVRWMGIGVPVSLAIVIAMFFIFLFLYPLKEKKSATPAVEDDAENGVKAGEKKKAEGEEEEAKPKEIVYDNVDDNFDAQSMSAASTMSITSEMMAEELARPVSWGEKWAAFAFFVAFFGWVMPPFLEIFDTTEWQPDIEKSLYIGVVPMLASMILFTVPDRIEKNGTIIPILPWGEALKVDWGLVMLFGGGITLGQAMRETGLALTIGEAFVDLTGVNDVWTLTVVFTIFTVFFTQICSNTASTNMLVPLVIGICKDLNVAPTPPCLGVALGASCGFMMPIATGPNAIVYGTGKIKLREMLKSGLFLNLAAAAIIFALLRALCEPYGWMDRLAPPPTPMPTEEGTADFVANFTATLTLP